ncbi:MAG: peroxidase family protein [Pyrinomonadaceae bacterium]
MPNPDYRTMFDELEPFYPELDDLSDLAVLMSGTSRVFDAGTIPAGYTYLAQFVVHDISLEEDSDRFFNLDRPVDILSPQSIGQIRNLRRPNFDLETIYGYAQPTNRGEPTRSELVTDQSVMAQLPLLKLGYTLGVDAGAEMPYPCDLSRGIASVMAKIVDPRNDENLLLAQTQVAFAKFHNALVVSFWDGAKLDPPMVEELFEKARRSAIRHYQTIILTDFLPRVLQKDILDEVVGSVRPNDLFYQPDLYVPLEFSIAAFRFGHSMVRESYDLNLINSKDGTSGPASLRNLQKFTGPGDMDSATLSPRLRLPSIWIIDWYRFYELGKGQINYAENINTRLPLALRQLRPVVAGKPGELANSLPALDLFRGRRLGLPAGQDVANKIGAVPLTVRDITEVIDRLSVDTMSETEQQDLKTRLIKAFGEKTPLWFYTLAEAELLGDGKLGLVGSRIVAETMIPILLYSEFSILQKPWEPGESDLLDGEKFSMPAMLSFIREMGAKHFTELYPDSPDYFDDLNPLG